MAWQLPATDFSRLPRAPSMIETTLPDAGDGAEGNESRGAPRTWVLILRRATRLAVNCILTDYSGKTRILQEIDVDE